MKPATTFFLLGIAMIIVGFFFPGILTSWGLPVRGLPFMILLFIFGYSAGRR